MSFSKKKYYYLALALAFVPFFIYHTIYFEKIVHGVTVSGIDLSGLTISKAQEKLEYLNTTDISLVVNCKDNPNLKEISVKASDIDLSYNIKETVRKAYLVGRSGNPISDTITKFSLFVTKTSVNPEIYYEKNLLDLTVSKIKSQYDTPFNNAYFYISENNILIEKEKIGKVVDKNYLEKLILSGFLSLNPSPIYLSLEDFNPQITQDDLIPLVESAKSIVFSNVHLTYKDSKYALKPEQILKALSAKSNGSIDLVINKTELIKSLDLIAEQINTPPKGQIFSESNGKVIDFRPSTPGRIMDSEALADIIVDKLISKGGQYTIPIPVKEIPVAENANSYGIKELLGEGHSTFKGSISSRVHNVALATKNISGNLIPPGDTFSFIKAVGEIDAKHGFSTAYIISKGRTVLGEGGGVCQVSTTLFRAVLNSGLPVINRVAHAYRVSYYEQDSDPGLDATIFSPSVDFSFRNDTENYLLVVGEVDEKNQSMVIKIYGTKDSREIEISKPVISSQSAPPEPVFEETQNLRVGEKQQVDWSAWGATVKFTRKVTKGDKLIINESFLSNYRPWRAVYLVGTRTD